MVQEKLVSESVVKVKGTRAKRYPDNVFDWITFHTEKLNTLRDELAELIQTPSGIEKLKSWNPNKLKENGEEELSKKIRFVIAAMKRNTEWEEELFNMTKVKVKMEKPKKK